ncbi:hypothetical protein JHW43_005289 [Diplocarpon mali]|nr:hypothetical protein JHW43_005289 [Diplocarpon mali]
MLLVSFWFDDTDGARWKPACRRPSAAAVENEGTTATRGILGLLSPLPESVVLPPRKRAGGSGLGRGAVQAANCPACALEIPATVALGSSTHAHPCPLLIPHLTLRQARQADFDSTRLDSNCLDSPPPDPAQHRRTYGAVCDSQDRRLLHGHPTIPQRILPLQISAHDFTRRRPPRRPPISVQALADAEPPPAHRGAHHVGPLRITAAAVRPFVRDEQSAVRCLPYAVFCSPY